MRDGRCLHLPRSGWISGSRGLTADGTLQGFDDCCLGFVVTFLRPTTFAMGETIYERGERGDEMYFIVDGVVALHTIPVRVEPGNDPGQQAQQQQRPLEGGDGLEGGQHHISQAGREQIAAKGDIFGEGCLLPDAAGLHRRERASAVSFVSAYALKATALQEIAEEYPEVCPSILMKQAPTVTEETGIEPKVKSEGPKYHDNLVTSNCSVNPNNAEYSLKKSLFPVSITSHMSNLLV